MRFSLLCSLVLPLVSRGYEIVVSDRSPLALNFDQSRRTVATNSAVLLGSTNTTLQPVSIDRNGTIRGGNGSIKWDLVKPNVARIEVSSSRPFIGASFDLQDHDLVYGAWEYPFSGEVTSNNVSFQLKGVGNAEGINWATARSPFFFTSSGYGVYIDTEKMGAFDFTSSSSARFNFNTSQLTYYVILPRGKNIFKGLLEDYASLSSTIEEPPQSGYGPTFWFDDATKDFPAGVSNAQENYYDVVDHLYHNEIRASGLFADRPYGTGNYSFGNFDFNLSAFPTPKEFISNLSSHGFDFQVWVADRAFLDTELYNASVANGWLFPGIDPNYYLGVAANLSIPAAYDYFKKKLAFFPSVGVKGYKIDRGEEGEWPDYEQNIQGPLFDKLCYESMEEHWGKGNFYNFARSVVDRARSRTAVWNGDAHANFTGLAYSVASGIRAGLIGFPMWGSDTGGYVRQADQPTEEVWARWMHFSTYSPMFEMPVGNGHSPWYAPYTPRLVQILKQAANEHHALLPFTRSYISQASISGLPVIRSLFLEAPNDHNPIVSTSSDQYFYGSELLVAPNVAEGGTRSVYFPKGSSYLDYNDKRTLYQGGSTSKVSVDLDKIPVFVREGAIIPRGDVYRGNNRWTKDWQPSLEIEFFPSPNVQPSRFAYFNGNETVDIVASIDEKGRSASIEYGTLGARGTAFVYGKQGVVKKPLKAGGGKLRVELSSTIFH